MKIKDYAIALIGTLGLITIAVAIDITMSYLMGGHTSVTAVLFSMSAMLAFNSMMLARDQRATNARLDRLEARTKRLFGEPL